jgi:tetracycline 7-halogenase / FADH2 O2-dependent halogenase
MIPPTDTDLAIVGSGFGGSILAMIARRLGYRVMLLERGRHPRFAIGESASPLAGVLIEQLADRYDLPRLRPLSAFGTWQRTYPDVVCGPKRGFTYFKHDLGARYRVAPDGSNRLLVAASPNDELSDTHWLRADVDHFLVREAIDLGVEYVDAIAVDEIAWDADGAARLAGGRHGARVSVRARFVVDASGPGGFLSRALGLKDRGFDSSPRTQALYSHFVDVPRCAELADFDGRDSTPYPIDDAALHHVFDGGWMWVLRFGNGVTSAGIAVEETLARDLRLADGEPAWRRFLARFPSITAQFAHARPIREFTWMPRVSYRASTAAGDGWAMLPSAAAFVDPLFSTGIPMTFLGIERLAAMLEPWRGLKPPLHDDRLAEASAAARYDATTLAEADHTARFVSGCYAAFPRFDVFAAYSMFYFVAASFSEMARRLTPGAASRGFLCAADRDFASALTQMSPAIAPPGSTSAFARQVADACAPLNIAGLCDPAKRNSYGIDVDDTIRAAAKLGVSAELARTVLMELMKA